MYYVQSCLNLFVSYSVSANLLTKVHNLWTLSGGCHCTNWRKKSMISPNTTRWMLHVVCLFIRSIRMSSLRTMTVAWHSLMLSTLLLTSADAMVQVYQVTQTKIIPLRFHNKSRKSLLEIYFIDRFARNEDLIKQVSNRVKLFHYI